MDALSQLYLPGAVTVWCAVLFGFASIWGYAQVVLTDGRNAMAPTQPSAARQATLSFARRGYLFFTLSVLLCVLVLFISLARRDFRIEYVSQYSGLDLPFHFQIAAFWAGQKGSFLIWLLWAALLGLPLRRSAGRDEAPVMGVYLLTLFGLLFILVRENPFVMLSEAPVDGTGLNPLLQDGWMVIHPPIMFIGYAASAIPFSFAFAAVWRGDTSRWATRAFPWALGGFLVLGTAILMGGYWAYKTLGWGGYWGWDPVENASLIPWLLGTVLIHGLYLERTRGRYRRANLVVACLLYLSVLYGTFLTRSGVLADFSVHSFVDLGISGWLVLYMAVFALASLYVAFRLPTVATAANVDPLLSRGAFMVLSTVTVFASALLVAIGTSAPLLTRFMENPGQVGPSFYNRVHMPLALLIALLLAVVPFLTWRGSAVGRLMRQLWPSLVVALLTSVVALAVGVQDFFHLIFVFLATAALASNLHKTIQLTRNHGLRRAGGYLAHVGVGVILLGVLSSSAYDQSAKVTLEQGKPLAVDDMTLTFTRFIPRQGNEKERMEIEVVRADGGTYFAYPKLFVNDRTRQLMANPHIHKLPLMDLYISPIQYDPGQPPGVDHRFQLARGQEGSTEGITVQFVDLDLSDAGNPTTRFASGQPVTIGARLTVTRDGEEESTLVPLYRLVPSGQVETPPVALPGGGWLAMTGLNPSSGTVQIDLAGIASEPPTPTLAIDLTRKPLINLVWYGLYIVLIGGAIATLQRFRHARQLEAMIAKTSVTSG